MKRVLILIIAIASAFAVMPSATAFPGGSFLVTCDLAKYGAFDPLTHMASHEHTFIGNKSITKDSTFSSMMNGSTNCSTTADKSGYWLPTFMKNGTRLAPTFVNVYYLARGHDRKPFPKGMIVKSEDVRYACSNNSGGSDHPIDCGSGTAQFNVTFFKDTTTYPEVHMQVKYSVHSLIGAKMTSDSMMPRHGDFFPVWNATKLQSLISTCLDAGRTCGRIKS